MLKQIHSTVVKRAPVVCQSVRSFQLASARLNDEAKPGFLDRVFGTKVEKATQAHSVLLADQQILYELQSEFLAFLWDHVSI